MNKEWRPNTAQYGTGEHLFIGKVKVGGWFNPAVSKGSPTLFRSVLHLPGMVMKDGTIDHPTREDAKARVERAVDIWFKWLEEEPQI